jgi:hypothetical protein
MNDQPLKTKEQLAMEQLGRPVSDDFVQPVPNHIATSGEIAAFCESFVKAQAKFGSAIKDSLAKGEKFSYKYADLSQVINAVLEHLNAEGISVMQWPALDGQMVIITTRLQHKSGQFMQSEIRLPGLQRDRFDVQSVGSAITYGCRYALQSICCVPREDDDGNLATERGQKEAKAKKEGEAELEKQLAESVKHTTPALFYVWHDASQTAEITGADSLKKVHKDVLRQYWNPNAKALVCNAEQLEELKYIMEQRHTEFRQLK